MTLFGPNVAAAGPRDPNERDVITRTWDLNLEGGLGWNLTHDAPLLGLARARGGLTWMDTSDIAAPRFYSLGVTALYCGIGDLAFGLQGELLDLSSGVWGQVGAHIDINTSTGLEASLGWSLFGVEAQVRFEDQGTQAALFLKLRIPIGIIAFSATHRE